MALNPMRCQLGFASGRRARRAGTCLLPMCCFQASGLPGRLRLEPNPTPSDRLVGGSAIIVVIRLRPLANITPAASIPENRRWKSKHVSIQYESTYGDLSH